MLVSVDVGYGFTKAVTEDGRRACFPSVVTRASGMGELAQSVGTHGPGPGHTMLLRMSDGEEERLVVGDTAALVGGVRTWDLSTSTRRDYVRLVYAAFSILGLTGNDVTYVDLAVGLPLLPYLQPEQRRALRVHLSGLRAFVQMDDQPGGEVEIRSTRVFAQAVGAYVQAAREDAPTAAGPVGLVDCGYRTTDYLLMHLTTQGPIPDEARSGSIDTGIGSVYETVTRQIAQSAAVLVPPGMIESALAATGTVMVRGKRYDVREMVEREAGIVAARIEDQVRRAWGDHLDFLDTLLLAGGGGQAMGARLRNLHPSARLLRDPLYANARGFLALAQTTPVA